MIEGMLNRVHHSDCLEGLRRLPDESIDVIVTSPPYWKGFEYEAYFNSYKQYLDWCEKWLKECKRVLKPTGTFYLNVINDSEITIRAFELMEIATRNKEKNSDIELPTEMPKDFAIRFSSKYMAEEIYDTYTGTLQKDLVENGTANANFVPSEETLKAIYSKVLEYQICSIDRKMTNDVLADKDGLQFSVSTNYTYEIKITANGNTYIIRGDDTAQGFKNTDNDAQNFVGFIGFMRSVLYETPEYKNLPDAVGGYD